MPTEDEEAEAVIGGLAGFELECGCGAKITIPLTGLDFACVCGTYWIVTDKDLRFHNRQSTPNEMSVRSLRRGY